MKRYIAVGFVILCAAVLSSQPSWREHVGKQADGSFLLSTGWRIKPVGAQVPLDTLPMSTALSKDGKYLLVLNGGYRPPSVSVVTTGAQPTVTSSVPVADAWLGLAFSPDGEHVYVGGGSTATVFEFAFSNGELKPVREMIVVPKEERKATDFIGDVAVSPDGSRLYAADIYNDSIDVINLQSGRLMDRYKTGRRPYRILFHPDGKSFFVSSWADGTVYLHNATGGGQIGKIGLGQHPVDMVLSNKKVENVDAQYRLFVAAANTNNVFVVGLDGTDMKVLESINVALTPQHPLGMTPSALALNPEQTKLFVACSDANVMAVADISEERSRVTGFIPTGWYPTAARVLADHRLLVLNGRGLGSYANPGYLGPKRAPANVQAGDLRREYIGNLQTGTMSVIDPVTDEALDQYTETAQSLSPYRDSQLDVPTETDTNVIFSRPDRPSPIQHVIYILKENRTYDQVFGKIGKGNSDPALCLFDESVAPNHYKLARQFILFDNFYVNADVSADGHNWATASIAPDYTQKMWPNEYAGRRKKYDFEGGEPANSPPAGYVWTNALAAGVSFRNYGHWVVNKEHPGPDGVEIEKVQDPALRNVTNMKYRAFDLDYADTDRVRVFLDDLKAFEAAGDMPHLIMMTLPNDHTNGTTPGKLSPLALFADNDYALGQIVDGVSHSKFWASTAIFVIEDDAQNGPDHVDSHRSPMLAISPYTQRGVIDSSFYNQSSILRTMELILGMKPLTHFDAGAHPLAAAFVSKPNNAPYAAEKPRVSLTEKNPARSTTAARSAKMDFDEADDIDDDELNEILWIAIKGTEPPPPVRSYFSARHF
jgi:DNA-binding beta-propeller fold protein YncE